MKILSILSISIMAFTHSCYAQDISSVQPLPFGTRMYLYMQWVRGKATPEERKVAQQTILKDGVIAGGATVLTCGGMVLVIKGAPKCFRKFERFYTAKTNPPLPSKMKYATLPPLTEREIEANVTVGEEGIHWRGNNEKFRLYVSNKHGFEINNYPEIQSFVEKTLQPQVSQYIYVWIGSVYSDGSIDNTKDVMLYTWQKSETGWSELKKRFNP